MVQPNVTLDLGSVPPQEHPKGRRLDSSTASNARSSDVEAPLVSKQEEREYPASTPPGAERWMRLKATKWVNGVFKIMYDDDDLKQYRMNKESFETGRDVLSSPATKTEQPSAEQPSELSVRTEPALSGQDSPHKLLPSSKRHGSKLSATQFPSDGRPTPLKDESAPRIRCPHSAHPSHLHNSTLVADVHKSKYVPHIPLAHQASN
jgi:hypothetical protein